MPKAVASNREQRPKGEAPVIPDHELLRCIGQGSYGEVWLARSVVGTWRAVKVVRRATFERAEHFEREFKGIQKFEPISRAHEGFVDILQIGRNDAAGYFYYVMELADSVISNQCSVISQSVNAGPRSTPVPLNTDALITEYSPKTLRAEQQRHTCLPVSDCVDIGVTLASALAHLHKRGLVHRDIKPSNIIFVGGVPKLADIGLVADASEARSFVGTVGFIPPEGPGSPQADLYSLGKVLYEISTGQDRQDFPQLPANLLRGESGAPSSGNPRPSVGRRARGEGKSDAAPLIELNEVLLKACHKEVHQRYPSADAMLAELALLHRGGSVKHKRTVERRFDLTKKSALVTAALVAAGVPWIWKKMSSGANSHAPTVTVASEMRGTKNRDAWNLYQQGKFFFDKQTAQDVHRSIDYFQKAIELDPNFALAHESLGQGYCNLVWFTDTPARECFTKGEASVRRALELDPLLPEAYSSLGYIKTKYGWDLQGAERLLRRSLELDPTSLGSLHLLALCLSDQGKADEAVALSREVLKRNPVHKVFNKSLGQRLLDARRYDEAIAAYQKTLELYPNDAQTWDFLGIVYDHAGRPDDAAAAYIETRRLGGASAAQSEEWKREYAAGGLKALYAKVMVRPEEAGTNYFKPVHAAMKCVRGGDNESAIRWLQKAYDDPLEFARIKTSPVFDPLRSDPRFIELLKRTGLEK